MSLSRECGKNEALEPQGSASLLVGQTYSIVSLKDLTENSTHNLRPGSPGIQVLQGPPGASSLSGVVEHCRLDGLEGNSGLPSLVEGEGQGNLRGLLLHRGLAGWFIRQRALRKLPSNKPPPPPPHTERAERPGLFLTRSLLTRLGGRGRRVADSCPEMKVLQESLCRDCEPDKDRRRSSLL